MSLPLEPLSLPLDLASMSLDLSMPAAEPDLADTVRVSVGAGGAAGSAPLLAGSLVAGLVGVIRLDRGGRDGVAGDGMLCIC